MVEAGCKFVTEDEIMEAVEFAQVEIRKQCELQEQFAKECGVSMPGEENARRVYQTALDKGMGKEDFRATIKVVREQ